MATTKKATTAAGGDEAAAGDVEARKPMPVPEGGWPPDEFTGKGGNYERDPFTGVRRRVGPDPDEKAA